MGIKKEVTMISILLSVFYLIIIYLNEVKGLYTDGDLKIVLSGSKLIMPGMNGIPYDDINCSIYGHHGIIYYPLVKLLGNNFYAIAITIAIFTGVSYLTCFYVVNYYIDNDLLFVVIECALIGTTATYFGAGNYFQILPHRIFFPMLFLAYLCWVERYKIKNRYWIETLLGILAIVFNLETGFCCLAVIYCYELFENTSFSIKYLLPKICKLIIYVGVCIIGSYLLVNIYSLSHSGTWNSARTFIYLIASTTYDMSGILRTPKQDPLTGYTLHVIVFILGICDSLYQIIYRKQRESRYLIYITISLSGMASLVYFMNRSAASCLAVSHIQLILVLVCRASDIWGNLVL